MITKMLEKRRMRRLLDRKADSLDVEERDELRSLQDKHGLPGAADARASELARDGRSQDTPH